jgi:uncharacterized OB-fold protein
MGDEIEPKPVPIPTSTSRPFWDGLAEGQILIQYSPSTDQWVFYPRVLAPKALADDLEWRAVSGAGVLYTFTVARHPTAPPWAGDVPQILAVVELEEGPRLTTELVGLEPEQVFIGMPVVPVLARGADGAPLLLRFGPDPSAQTRRDR